MAFNLKHPELRESEVFLCNATREEYAGLRCYSKRKGKTAYTNAGRIYRSKNGKKKFPVFIRRSEMEKRVREYLEQKGSQQ